MKFFQSLRTITGYTVVWYLGWASTQAQFSKQVPNLSGRNVKLWVPNQSSTDYIIFNLSTFFGLFFSLVVDYLYFLSTEETQFFLFLFLMIKFVSKSSLSLYMFPPFLILDSVTTCKSSIAKPAEVNSISKPYPRKRCPPNHKYSSCTIYHLSSSFCRIASILWCCSRALSNTAIPTKQGFLKYTESHRTFGQFSTIRYLAGLNMPTQTYVQPDSFSPKHPYQHSTMMLSSENQT